MSQYLVTVERTIPASAQELFDILADPAQHPVIDGSGSVRGALPRNPPRLSLGAEFGMDMKLGARYRITNRVIEFEEGHRIAWRHFNGHIWRYVFDQTDDATGVSEQWDASHVWNRFFLALVGFPRRNRRGMEATLARLQKIVAGDHSHERQN